MKTSSCTTGAPSSGALRRIRSSIQLWQRKEDGVSEVTSAIFVLPFLAFFIFALIEAGFAMRARTLVDNVTSDTVRSISQDGALYWARTSPGNIVSADHTWTAVGEDELAQMCERGGSACTAPPTMECAVGGDPVTVDGVGIQIARTAGAEVTCTSTFHYSTVSPLSRNPITSLGLSTFFTRAITTEVTGRTVVGCSTGDASDSGCE